MKLLTLLSFLYLSQPIFGSDLFDIRKLFLQERFRIDGPVFTYDSFQFDFSYNVSDFMGDDMISFQIFDGHACRNGANEITENDYLIPRLRPDLKERDPNGDGGWRMFKLALNIDVEKIRSSSIFEDYGNYADVRFCVVFSNYNMAPDEQYSMEVNFVETPVYLQINLLGSFNVEARVTNPDLVLANAYQDSAVVAFLCDYDDNVLKYGTNRNQGESVRICVKPTPEVLARGGYMKYIDEFTFEQGEKKQQSIRSGTGGDAANPLTEVSCIAGSELCAFETLLAAEFFADPNNTVIGAGTAYLQLGRGNYTSEQRRDLQAGQELLDQLYASGASAQEILDLKPTAFGFTFTFEQGEEWNVDISASFPTGCTVLVSLVVTIASTLLFWT